jgi:hypothetical protein
MVNEPCASLVLTSNTATSPAARSAETSRTKGARAAELRGATMRNGGLPVERVGGRGAGAGAGRRVGGLTGCALTPPP